MHKSLRLVLAAALPLIILTSISARGAVSQAGSTPVRQTLDADAHWKFFLGDPANAQAPSFDDISWRNVTLPHDWSIEGKIDKNNPSAGGGGYFAGGVGWYRRTFTAPASWRGKQVTVHFEGVAANATIYLNGHELGIHPYAYTSFRFDLTHWLNLGKSNVLAVRVDDSGQPASRWYMGAGIYRHVQVIVTDPIHVAPWGVFVTTPEATDDAAKLIVKTSIANTTSQSARVSVETTILSPNDQTVAHTSASLTVNEKNHAEATTNLSVAHPQLWSPDSPHLYRAVTEVLQDGKPIDRVETTFGIRTLSWSIEKGLQLNGKSIKLQGGSVHHANGPLGAAAFDRAEERRVQLLKDAGFNAVRTAHNPPSPEFLSACDRLGLLVLDEPFDVWKTDKVKYDYAHIFDQWWRKDIDSMVLRDRNHPSIIIWGIGNEIQEAWTPAGAPIAKQLAGSIRALDGTRPITEAFPGATYTPSVDAVMAQLDIAGYNYNLVQNNAKDHARVPSRIMMTTESMPANAFAQWQTIHEHPYTLGEFVWTAMDYLGESGIGAPVILPTEQAKQADDAAEMMKFAVANMGADGKNPFAAMTEQQKKQAEEKAVKQKESAGNLMSLMFHGYPWHAADCGDIDLIGHRKPQSYYRDILWKGGDRVYATVRAPIPAGKQYVQLGWSVYPTLHSWTWPGQESKDMQVEVYAGTEKVRLYLNGKLIGEQPTGVNEQRRALFVVPYVPGTLKAVGVNGDQEVASDIIETAGAPARLKLTADRATLHADGEDLSYITVEAVDAEGRIEPNESTEVHFTVSGPATIAAVGNGNGQSTESYRGNQRALFHGRALVILRTITKTGPIHLEATAPGLKSANIDLQAEAAAPRAELP
ncbi:MAG TPA: glycoside hydrolase family 2 TIM barrel-domain containing protein [Terracidiphilus sp.]|nr:glycoside hydrolase family 2 TIM barrel-domain containing protein [Terracidiphilus sp.]